MKTIVLYTYVAQRGQHEAGTVFGKIFSPRSESRIFLVLEIVPEFRV